MIKVGNKAPKFAILDQEGKTHTLSQYQGKKILLYFYPKDDTPGCTTEACNFRDGYDMFTKMGLVILGVSKDGVESHKKFAEKFSLPFPLLADESTDVSQAYGVWKQKKFMGRKYMGINRTSFLIDEKGVITKIYEGVKANEHAKDVEDDLV